MVRSVCGGKLELQSIADMLCKFTKRTLFRYFSKNKKGLTAVSSLSEILKTTLLQKVVPWVETEACLQNMFVFSCCYAGPHNTCIYCSCQFCTNDVAGPQKYLDFYFFLSMGARRVKISTAYVRRNNHYFGWWFLYCSRRY